MFKYRNELVFFDSIDGQPIFYAPTLGICMLCTAELTSRMKAHLNGEILFEEFEKLLSSSWASRMQTFNLESVKSKYFHIALGLTENCTLSCVYCHADAGKPTLINDELLVASASYAQQKVRDKNLRGINLSFAVGGEPTFHFGVLEKALSLFQSAADACGVDLKTSMTTNGYYNSEKANYVASKIDNILISIDGVEDIQNIHRPTRQGTESFTTVVNTMNIVYEKKSELNVRSTISSLNVHRMREFIDYLALNYPHNTTWVVEPLVPLGRGAFCETKGVCPPDKMEFAENFWDAYIYGLSKGIKLKTSAMNAERLVSGFCGAMFIPSFTVTTGGIITTCERDSTGGNYGYGHYDENCKEFVFDKNVIERNKKLINIPEKCSSCICRYHCAGDCPDIRTINYNRCETNRYLLKRYLMFKMQRKEGLSYEAGSDY